MKEDNINHTYSNTMTNFYIPKLKEKKTLNFDSINKFRTIQSSKEKNGKRD